LLICRVLYTVMMVSQSQVKATWQCSCYSTYPFTLSPSPSDRQMYTKNDRWVCLTMKRKRNTNRPMRRERKLWQSIWDGSRSICLTGRLILTNSARRQLAFDIWWLGFALWLICIIEVSQFICRRFRALTISVVNSRRKRALLGSISSTSSSS